VSGAAGSNECPAGSVRIETEAACRTAAAAAGKNVVFLGTWSTTPRGCYYSTYYSTYDNAYFNTHVVGDGNFNTQLLCAAVATGAPLSPPMRDAPVHRRVQCHCVCEQQRACNSMCAIVCAFEEVRCCSGKSGICT
jgi:hypothetical protein